MAASDLVSVWGQVMEYPYIPTGIKAEMVRSGMDCHRKGQVVGTVGRRPVAIHSSGETISSLAQGHLSVVEENTYEALLYSGAFMLTTILV